MELYSAFVTGATRGIGLEFVRQLVQLPTPPKYIFATYRSKDGLQALESIQDSSKNSTTLVLIRMDTTKTNEIEAARQIVQDTVGDKGLTLLINNAGVCERLPFPKVTEESLLHHFKTNTMGPTMIIQELLPLLERAAAACKDSEMGVQRAAIINISAGLGSISEVDINKKDYLGVPSYQISKAALNMMGRLVAAKVKKNGILVVSMCPGWVKTDMGSERAELTVDESVSNMMETLATLNESHHGEFMDRNGNLYTY